MQGDNSSARVYAVIRIAGFSDRTAVRAAGSRLTGEIKLIHFTEETTFEL